MSENLYDALDDCLAALQRGDDIESCLARHAQLADDLRPLLAAAAGAQSLAMDAVPVEAAKRGRARLLNQAAELRERAATSPYSRPAVGFRFRYSFRLALSALAAVLVAFALGGVGLVFASSGSLPGDRLYPIKLSLEGIQLQLTADQRAREALQEHFDDERVGEVDQLARLGRAEDVHFGGLITAVFPDHIIVSNITVLVVPQTKIEGTLILNAYAKVQGLTQPDGAVLASEIKVPTSPAQPEGIDDSGGGSGGGGGSDDGSGSSGGPGSSGESTPEAVSFDLQGKISSVKNGAIVVGGTTIVLNDATEIRGTLVEGVTVRARGVVRSNGAFTATRVDVISDGHDDGDNDGDSSHATATPKEGGSGSSGHSTPKPETFDLEGTISSMNDGSIVVAGRSIVLNHATEIRGRIAEGVTVRARGTVGADGSLIATRVEVISSGGDDDGG